MSLLVDQIETNKRPADIRHAYTDVTFVVGANKKQWIAIFKIDIVALIYIRENRGHRVLPPRRWV